MAFKRKSSRKSRRTNTAARKGYGSQYNGRNRSARRRSTRRTASRPQVVRIVVEQPNATQAVATAPTMTRLAPGVVQLETTKKARF